MNLLPGVLRVSVVILLAGSGWYGWVAGARRWQPCADYYDAQDCLTAQSHETANLAELAYPESTSLALLGGALLLLALLGSMPVGWRLLALTTGPVCWWLAAQELRDIGQTEVVLLPPGGHQTTALEALARVGFFLTPLVLTGVGLVLLTRPSSDRDDQTFSDRVLGCAWFAIALGWPLPEYFLLNLIHLPYVSFDAPPGTGLLRSALTVVAAVLVLGHLAARRTASTTFRSVVRRRSAMETT